MILVDSNVIIAACITQDLHHRSAVNLLQNLDTIDELAITVDIISETLNFISKRGNSTLVCRYGLAALQDTRYGKVIEPAYEDRLTALAIINKYKDQRLSYVDALSFAVIRRLKITHVISFDSDFNLLKNVTNLAHKHCL